MSLIINKNNKLISKKDIENIIFRYNIRKEIRNLKLYQQAFVHKSYCSEYTDGDNEQFEDNIPLFKESYEKLEWYGDSVLSSVISTMIWNRFPGESEGFYTKLRSRLVRTSTLAKLSRALGLDNFLILSEHVEQNQNGRTNDKILEDCLEAFIGAMLIDFSNDGTEPYEYAVMDKYYKRSYLIINIFIRNIFESEIDLVDILLTDDNYKDRLMRYFHKEFNGMIPLYHEDGYDSKTKYYKIFVNDMEGVKIGEGFAKSKKMASQYAAKQALDHFGILELSNTL